MWHERLRTTSKEKVGVCLRNIGQCEVICAITALRLSIPSRIRHAHANTIRSELFLILPYSTIRNVS